MDARANPRSQRLTVLLALLALSTPACIPQQYGAGGRSSMSATPRPIAAARASGSAPARQPVVTSVYRHAPARVEEIGAVGQPFTPIARESGPTPLPPGLQRTGSPSWAELAMIAALAVTAATLAGDIVQPASIGYDPWGLWMGARGSVNTSGIDATGRPILATGGEGFALPLVTLQVMPTDWSCFRPLMIMW